jgi:hypothetical protein
MMKKHTVRIVVMTTAFMLNSCLALQSLQPVEALLQQPSVKSRLILENAIGDLLNSQPIKLADNVFLQKSTVIIDRRQPRDNRGNLLDGREMRQGDTVSLFTEGGKCYVKHDQSGNIKLVDKIDCNAK